MDKAEIRKIARIARLDLSEAEEDQLEKQINDILEEFKVVQEMGGRSECHYMTSAETVLRKDGEPQQGEDVLSNIPVMESGFVKTPKGI